MLELLEALSWLQPPPSAGGGGGGGGGDAVAGAPAGCAGGGMMGWGYIAVMFAVFWFLIIAPQRKQQKAQDDMRAGLKKGDIVRTSGGIRGEIVTMDIREVTLKIAEKTKINVLRTHIAGPDVAGDAAAKDKT